MTATKPERTTTQFMKEHPAISLNFLNDWAKFWVLIFLVHLIICYYHDTYAFQSESTLYICLNVKKFFDQNRRDIWYLSNFNGTRTHNHLVRTRTLNILAELTKWLNWHVNTYLYGACDCMLLSSHVHISEWIHALHLAGCQETFCFKQARYLKFKWLQRDSNAQTLSL